MADSPVHDARFTAEVNKALDAHVVVAHVVAVHKGILNDAWEHFDPIGLLERLIDLSPLVHMDANDVYPYADLYLLFPTPPP